ncbi:DUF493 domain-containing protein [Vulgatibacter sp.]|uniref:DUF493 domain-containing protein n=1 Tax=Vulgatibacter sp. TaxID=1971226 RepID=UPI0035690735
MTETPANAPLLKYPCFYTFKAIGKAEGAPFDEHVRGLVGGILGYVSPDSCSIRESGKGNYHSVSVLVHLQSEEQRRAVYESFWKDERVVFYL